jgi:hypothetical protein
MEPIPLHKLCILYATVSGFLFSWNVSGFSTTIRSYALL